MQIARGSALLLSLALFACGDDGGPKLIDSGIGAKDRRGFPNGRLPEVMSEEGVAPGDIDMVMATHIHIDHVGWHTTKQGDECVPTFPGARHIFAREEYEFFTAPSQVENPGLPWVKDCVLPLDGRVQIDLVDKDVSRIEGLPLLMLSGRKPE